MKRKLIVIATPIGNINEISKATINALSENKNFFCEDTRVLKKLLNVLGISISNKNFYALNNVNENSLVEKFNFNDETYCLTSDAGYPMLSDPGYFLINYFIKQNWEIQIINGPSALMHSLIVSGFPTQKFIFFGFLSHKNNQKKSELIELKNENKTIIIYESIHRIKETLKMIKDVFGDNVNLVVCRELTKLNETIYRGKIDDILDNIVEKGEIVIVINNNKINNDNKTNYELFLNEISSLVSKGEKDKIACKIVAYKHGIKTNALYSLWQEKKNNI